MAEIIFTAGAFAGRRFELPDSGLVIGKKNDADLILQDPSVSGQHAKVTCLDGIWRIRDLQSTNGTSVNGREIEVVELKDGDQISMGDTVFVFKMQTAEESGAAAGAETSEAAMPAPAPVRVEPPAPMPSAPTPPAPRAPVPEPAAFEPPQAAMASKEDVQLVQQMRDRTDAIRREVGKVIVGQREVLDQVLMCMMASGHALLIGLPGMAKTLMVSTIAKVLDMKFKRVQFTPDLMPADIIGSDVLETDRDTGEKQFRFITGPLFCNLLLADEINRTPPKTQAALLEAMQEKHVTTGNTTYPLDKPFFVLATQNPIEQEGTYPLPEAQLDRFMFNIWVDYPESHEEEQIVGTTTSGTPVPPQKILSREQVIQLQEVVKKIPVSQHVIKYVIRLVRATRPSNEDSPEVTKKYISTGAGPRAGQYLVLAAKARAVLEGRIHVSCNDIRNAAIPVLRHRLITNFSADSEGLTSMSIIKQLLEIVKEPGEQEYTAAPAEASKKGLLQKLNSKR